MGRLDARQFANRRRIKVGEHEEPITAPTDVLKIWGKLWYLRSSKKVMIKARIVKSKTNAGILVSRQWEEDWPGGGDLNQLKAHLRATVRKYKALYRSGDWPAEDNYLTRCNAPWEDSFVADVCADCSATYCTVDR